jgi:hypothetical protein
MSNKIFQHLVDQSLQDLVSYFQSSKDLFWDPQAKKLLHAGEYGTYREELVARLLRLLLPERLKIGSGFVISNQGDISTQCDLIVYDCHLNPPLENLSRQRFFPIESVVGVGEVKSSVTSAAELRKALEKLAVIKGMRERTRNPEPVRRISKSPYDPIKNQFDQIFTFLFANDFAFELTKEITSDYDPVIPVRHRHNCIVGIHGPLALYSSMSGQTALYFPVAGEVVHPTVVINKRTSDEFYHLRKFLIQLANGIGNITTLEVDYALYLTDDSVDVVK